MIPPDLLAELDAAYDALNLTVQGMLDNGDDPRAIIGGLGRLFVQMMNEELSVEERREMVASLLSVLHTEN